MWFSLAAKVAFYMYINGRQVYYFRFENNNVTGGAGGLMPYSRMKTYPGYSYALGEVKLLRMHKQHFTELELLNPDFIQKLIGYMTGKYEPALNRFNKNRNILGATSSPPKYGYC